MDPHHREIYSSLTPHSSHPNPALAHPHIHCRPTMKIYLLLLVFSLAIWSTIAGDSPSALLQESTEDPFNPEDFMSPEPSAESGAHEDSKLDIEKLENTQDENENDDADDQEPEPELDPEDRQENFDDEQESLEQEEVVEQEDDENSTDLDDSFEKFEQLDDDIGEGDELDDDVSGLNSTEHVKKKDGKKKPVKKFWVWVTLSTKSSAAVYHNRRFVGAVKHWTHVRTFKFKARRRDTIGIISSGSSAFHGVVAAIKVAFPQKRRLYVTGRSGFFKAIAVSKTKSRDRKFWRTRFFKTCHWRRPVSVRPQKGKRFAKRFPLKKLKAKYIWARGERKGKPVLIRFKVGGERCKPVKPTPRPGPKRCACRPVKTKINGECYEFTNPKMSKTFNRNARCKKRDCTPSYECVSSGRKPKTLCVRRFATSEVRIVGRVFKRVCRNVRVRPAKPFYVPYEK